MYVSMGESDTEMLSAIDFTTFCSAYIFITNSVLDFEITPIDYPFITHHIHSDLCLIHNVKSTSAKVLGCNMESSS